MKNNNKKNHCHNFVRSTPLAVHIFSPQTRHIFAPYLYWYFWYSISLRVHKYKNTKKSLKIFFSPFSILARRGQIQFYCIWNVRLDFFFRYFVYPKNVIESIIILRVANYENGRKCKTYTLSTNIKINEKFNVCSFYNVYRKKIYHKNDKKIQSAQKNRMYTYKICGRVLFMAFLIPFNLCELMEIATTNQMHFK